MPSPAPSSQVASDPRFTSQASTAEDLLKSQTVGLVHLSDFRKRRAEALEQKEREAQDRSYGRFKSTAGSGAATPSDGASTPQPPKKKRKNVAKGKLSFGVDDEDREGEAKCSENETSGTNTPAEVASRTGSPAIEKSDGYAKKKLGPNANLSVAPKALTKSALLKEAQTRELLRKEFLLLQEAVKATEVAIPFVFYDGTNTPGGICKIKKGDYIWVFLDRCRKMGAQLGVGATGEKINSRREWARVGVDDLMLVRGEIIIPHHYEFYYFVVNRTKTSGGIPLFDYSAQPPPTASPSSHRSSATSSPPDDEQLSSYNPLSQPSSSKNKTNSGAAAATTPLDSRLEGYSDDPSLTKVVDRRWYERNKHIFPASVWEEFDPAKDYSQAIRKDAQGNAFFFS